MEENNTRIMVPGCTIDTLDKKIRAWGNTKEESLHQLKIVILSVREMIDKDYTGEIAFFKDESHQELIITKIEDGFLKEIFDELEI